MPPCGVYIACIIMFVWTESHLFVSGVSHMVLSNFSHVEVWHFGINMLAFSSFASGVMCKHKLFSSCTNSPTIHADVLGDTVCCAKSLAFLTTAGEDFLHSLLISLPLSSTPILHLLFPLPSSLAAHPHFVLHGKRVR